MCLPETNWPWQSIHNCGFKNLVSLHPMEHDPTPLTSVYSLPLEDLVHGDPPKNPLLEISKIRSATSITLQSLSDCKGVVVHCWGGRGRTGTVLGWVMRAKLLWNISMRSDVLGAGKDGQRQFGNQKLLGNGRMREKSPNFWRVGLLRRFSDKICADFV